MLKSKYKRGRVLGGQRSEYNLQTDNERWGLRSYKTARRWRCNHDATRGTKDGAMCFACWLQSKERRPVVESHPRGAILCVMCYAVLIEDDDTCPQCQAEMNARIAARMAEPPPEPTSDFRDRRVLVPRTTCVLTLSGDSGSVRMGRVGRVVR